MSPTLSVRDGYPAIDVRDRTLWARDSRTAHFYDVLGESVIAEIYDGVQADFWQDIAPDIGREHGYDDVSSAGRSAGWLIVGGTSFLDYLNADDPWSGVHDTDDTTPLDDGEADPYVVAALLDRDRFMRFADAIAGAVKAAGEMFVQRLTERAAELDRARENAIVRGEN